MWQYLAQQGRLRTTCYKRLPTKSLGPIGVLPQEQRRTLRTGIYSTTASPASDASIVDDTGSPSSPKLTSKVPHAQHQNTIDRYVIDSISQGVILDAKSRNKQDPQYASAQEGRTVRLRGSGSPLDAASAENGIVQMKPLDIGIGNKEGVGFVEQVGSASATARMFEERDLVRAKGLKVGREIARESFENARASALARKLVG